MAYQDSKTPLEIEGEIFSFRERSGILDPIEICSLTTWRISTLCQNLNLLNAMTTQSYGSLANILQAPHFVRVGLIPDYKIGDEEEIENLWDNVLQSRGLSYQFDRPPIGGFYYRIFINSNNEDRILLVDLDARISETGRPFEIRNLGYVNKMKITPIANYIRSN